jgi:hypothetical protein
MSCWMYATWPEFIALQCIISLVRYSINWLVLIFHCVFINYTHHPYNLRELWSGFCHIHILLFHLFPFLIIHKKTSCLAWKKWFAKLMVIVRSDPSIHNVDCNRLYMYIRQEWWKYNCRSKTGSIHFWRCLDYIITDLRDVSPLNCYALFIT